jgi:alkylation response protein AidB-like acyl-CoA dehydrogenase
MTIGVTQEHAALAEAVRGWALHHAPIAVARAAAEDQGKEPSDILQGLGDQGFLGMHLTEEHGGGGATYVEAGVAAYELGRALAAGVFLPTVVTSALLQLDGGTSVGYLPRLVDGSTTGAAAVAAAGLVARRDEHGLVVTGTTDPILGAGSADLLVLAAALQDDPDTDVWFVVPSTAADVQCLDSADCARPLARVSLHDARVPDHDVLTVRTGEVRDVAVSFAAAEAAGIAQWCLETAVEYAKVRGQFGRPIGQFQAVKHACADMLTQVEQARAAAWDAARALADPAARPLTAAVAGAVALDAAVACAKACIQILGGIGFTWEHDAHLYLRRAVTLRQLLGPVSHWRSRAASLALDGSRRSLALDLPEEQTAEVRRQTRAFLSALDGLDEEQRRRQIADAGYINPHWPSPWGRDATPVEQVVIAEEFAAAGVTRPDLVIGGWILPTLIAHGTPEQQERFVGPTLRGEITWCQMFSEPGAGSDLAALRTAATRIDGGWRLTGQKVWTSLAHRSDFGLCLARTDPSAPKHKGITCFIVDMGSDGLDIRPLRELTGRAMFNEVFLTDVFVPDELVVGEVNNGWRAGRTTLANERVAMSSGSTMGAGVEGVLRMLGRGSSPDPTVLDRAGALVCEGQVLALLGLRTTLRQLQGVDPGAGSSVRKLVGMRHAQECAELLLELLGPAGATMEGDAATVVHNFLQSRCLTIAGGTTEVQRNVIAERLLGLPRDPDPVA